MDKEGCSSMRGWSRRMKGKLTAMAPCKPRQKAKTVEGVKFPCLTCNREFDNAQALGGHQNAHRKEREEEERHYREAMRQQRANHRNASRLPVPAPLLAPVTPHVHSQIYGTHPPIWYGSEPPSGHPTQGPALQLYPNPYGYETSAARTAAVFHSPSLNQGAEGARPSCFYDFMGTSTNCPIGAGRSSARDGHEIYGLDQELDLTLRL